MTPEVQKQVVQALETAIRWLRRLEKEFPGCLNEDAIEKHLESVLGRVYVEQNR